MSRLRHHGQGPRRAPRVDRDGELYAGPTALTYVWIGLIVLLLFETANELFGIGGPSSLYEIWFHDVVLAAAAVLILVRAAYEPKARRAWLAIGLATASWSVGTIAWSIAYGAQSHPPYPTFADVLWLAWYPLMAWGIVSLIKVRIPHFELHRWMDGLAVTLVVLAAGFALVIEPLADKATGGWLSTIVDFSYPVLDVLLMGAIVGVYGLLAWRPDPVWLLLGAGILMTTIADAAFSIQQARGVADVGRYDFVWTLGALLIAFAAWVRAPSQREDAVRPTGLRSVALPLIAQALAAGVQIYALFEPVGKSERIGTVAVLVVSSVQIYITRPRAHPSPVAEPSPEETTGGSEPASATDQALMPP